MCINHLLVIIRRSFVVKSARGGIKYRSFDFGIYMRLRHAITVTLLISILVIAPIVAGSSTLTGANVSGEESEQPPKAVGSSAQSAPRDPVSDTLGWERGYWHNESIDIDQTDGLSESELDAFVARSMARVERIRGLEFTEDVEVEFVPPEKLDAPRNDTFGLSTNEQLWEALFFYGESTNASRAVHQAQAGSVLGFAAEEGSDRIVIVGQPSQPTVGGATLVHELAHMLQDQQFNLSQSQYQRSTTDGEFAKDGLVEGEAAYITDRYRSNCQNQWSCVENPSNRDNAQRSGSARFYRFTYFPYSAGKAYVQRLVENSGWMAVTGAHAQPPVSTEQVIHPNTKDQPSSLTVADTSRNGWHRLNNSETIGEAGIYTLFWRQSGEGSPISEANRSRSGSQLYNYASRPSSGWGNDRLYTYANGDKRGYVWKTNWDTERDAREFRDAYLSILKTEGATQRGAHTWRIENGSFADAFSVTRTGTTVTIVNGPTEALGDIHPKTVDTNATNTTRTNTAQATSTSTAGPGFTGVAAITALVLVGVALRH